ncbi:hypothetical protein [Sanyastnella coralliicola]|uniref:hypothetical protein n=1 Tax=Sanyastnella coralliicola TaxID=3069118 RepID=UPI0027BA7E12|nr:hypothetical protein [Longitalea sp. SCSIO 12813]
MRKFLYAIVLLIGALQIIGWSLQIQPLRQLGMAYCSSPLPIVFTEVRGVETFANDFYMEYEYLGEQHQTKITPEIYSQLEGPYNRRNVYGAAISYGPVLPNSIWSAVLNYGVCNGTLLEELGIPAQAENVQIRIKSRTVDRNDEWILTTDCDS